MIEKCVLAQMDIINKKKRIDLLPTLLNQANQLNWWWWISHLINLLRNAGVLFAMHVDSKVSLTWMLLVVNDRWGALLGSLQ